MSALSRSTHPLARWVLIAIASGALAGQVGVTLAPFGEAREGRGMVAHVEAGGTSAHYAHNDATCATCQARSLHGFAVSAPVIPPARYGRATVFLVAAERRPVAELLAYNNPRAPPIST